MSYCRRMIPLLLLFLLALACQAEPVAAPVEVPGTQEITLIPYSSPTVTVTPTMAPTVTPYQPTSTATPRVYTVKAGDTMSAIALNYSIDLSALLAANPTVNPYALSTGMTLLLPAPDPNYNQTPTLPSPTPVAVILAQPVCYPQLDTSLWCFVRADNPGSEAIENVTTEVCISTADEQRRCQTAIPIIDLLPAGGSMALTTRFDAPAPIPSRADAMLISAVTVVSTETRYVPLELSVASSTSSLDGLRTQISGSIKNISGRTAAGAWVAVIAYNAEDQIVGVRRWEGTSSLASSASTSFTLTVYSSAGAISRVDFLTQAWP